MKGVSIATEAMIKKSDCLESGVGRSAPSRIEEYASDQEWRRTVVKHVLRDVQDVEVPEKMS